MFSWTQLEPIAGHGLVRTIGHTQWSPAGKDYRIMLPPSFYSDGASVPKWAWPMLGAGPIELLHAGLVHDYCVRIGAVVEVPVPGGYGRRRIDSADEAIRIMDDVMEWSGISGRDRAAVRLALDATDIFYWHKKDLTWTGTYSPS